MGGISPECHFLSQIAFNRVKQGNYGGSIRRITHVSHSKVWKIKDINVVMVNAPLVSNLLHFGRIRHVSTANWGRNMANLSTDS